MQLLELFISTLLLEPFPFPIIITPELGLGVAVGVVLGDEEGVLVGLEVGLDVGEEVGLVLGLALAETDGLGKNAAAVKLLLKFEALLANKPKAD